MTPELFDEMKDGDVCSIGSVPQVDNPTAYDDVIGVKSGDQLEVYRGSSVDKAGSVKEHRKIIQKNGERVTDLEFLSAILSDELIEKVKV